MPGAIDAKAGRLFSAYLDTVGDGSGEESGVGDFSDTARTLKIKPSTGETLILSRLTVDVVDAGSIDADRYGAGLTLSDGISVRVTRRGEVCCDLTNGHPVLTNSAWLRLASSGEVANFGGGNNHFLARWLFMDSGQMIVLSGDKEEAFEVVLSDDFSDLEEHLFHVQGIRHP